MDHAVTYAELAIRKWWLRALLAVILFEVISDIDAMGRELVPFNALYLIIGTGSSLSYKLLFYYFGYLKRGTKFLTFAIFLFVLVTTIRALSFFFKILFFQEFYFSLPKSHPLFSFIFYLTYFTFFYATVKLRRINKIRKLISNPQTLT